jgi:hypothetical protein
MNREPTRLPLRALLLALCVAACAMPAAAGAQPLPGDPLRQRPLELLLEARETLGLTAAQVARLEEVKVRLDARNEPLVERLLVLRAAWQQERMALRLAGAAGESERLAELRQRSQQLLHEIEFGHRAAMMRVSRLLTPEQRLLLREMVRERRIAQ